MTVTLLRRTVGALADLAAAGAGRTVVVGDEPNRITAELVELDVEPSEVLNVLDPTAVDARLAESIRLPGSLSDLVAPVEGGCTAPRRERPATVTQAMLAAGGGRYELAAGVRLTVGGRPRTELVGPSDEAARRAGRVLGWARTLGAVHGCRGRPPCSDDRGPRAAGRGAPDRSVAYRGRPGGAPAAGSAAHPLTFRVWPRLHGGRIALEDARARLASAVDSRFPRRWPVASPAGSNLRPGWRSTACGGVGHGLGGRHPRGMGPTDLDRDDAAVGAGRAAPRPGPGPAGAVGAYRLNRAMTSPAPSTIRRADDPSGARKFSTGSSTIS